MTTTQPAAARATTTAPGHSSYPAPVDTARADRSAVALAALSLAALSAVCVPFLLGPEYPAWMTLLGRWIPALVSLLVMRLLPAGGTLPQLWGLRPTSVRSLLTGLAVGVVAVLATAFVPALIGQVAGLAELKPWSTLAPVLMAVPVYALAGSLSTLGEEVVWRGHLHQLLERRGFWFTAVSVSAFWAVFHLPQLAVFVRSGDLATAAVGPMLLGIFGLGLLLAALVQRFRTVWPAVVGHAVPVTAALVVEPTSGAATWIFTLVTVAVCAVAAALLAPRGR